MVPSDTRQRLETLARSAYDSEALNNPFFDRWLNERVSLDEITILARNFGEVTKEFPNTLCQIIIHTHDVEAKAEYVKTLYSEMGYGEADKVHFILFCDFIRGLTTYMGHPMGWDDITAAQPLLPSSVAYMKESLALYTKDPATAAGAQLAQEWQAYTLIRQLYEGSRQYLDLWPTRDGFHEDCEYFYAHIGEAEKEHKEQALIGAAAYATSPEELAKIEQGFHAMLNAYASFWKGVATAMQPTSAAKAA